MSFVTRRDLLIGLGGGVAGTLLTPLPWSFLRDVAIRTQHRRALPIPSGGEPAVRSAACTLCPAGCALRVRTVGGRPVFVAGERRHPLGGGACALGLAIHHLAHHPRRLEGPARSDGGGGLTRIGRDAAIAAIAQAIRDARRSGSGVLVLDQRPGRVTSRAYREVLAALPEGVYATLDGEDATLVALSPRVESDLAIDLGATRTLLSFGAPVLESWGRPGRVAAARARLRVVQVDAWRSPSATLADEWLAARPGSEGALALGLARVVVEAGLVASPSDDVKKAIAPFDPVRVASLTGIEASRIEALGRSLATGGPALAIGGGDPGGGPLGPDAERAIALLDVLLGATGSGAIVARRGVPDPDAAPQAPVRRLADVPDGRCGLLILDAASAGRALPWPALERKLAPGALVVSLSPFHADLARHARLHVPAPAPLEAYDEVLPTLDAPAASYAVAPPLVRSRLQAIDPIVLLHHVAQAAGLRGPSDPSLEEALKRRVEAIRASGRGRLLARGDDGFDEAPAADADSFWQTLVAGGCWVDDVPRSKPAGGAAPLPSPEALDRWLRAAGTAPGLFLVAVGARGTVGGLPPSPILTKLYQETDLRLAVGTVWTNPATAARLRLVEGRRVRVESPAGTVEGRLRCDAAIASDCVALAAGPEPCSMRGASDVGPCGALPLATLGDGLVWRRTLVRIREA